MAGWMMGGWVGKMEGRMGESEYLPVPLWFQASMEWSWVISSSSNSRLWFMAQCPLPWELSRGVAESGRRNDAVFP